MALDVLVRLFDRIDLRTHANKMKGMVGHPYSMADENSEAAYTRRMKGVGTYLKERQQ